MENINFFSTNISKKVFVELNKVLKSGFISAGKQSELFESKLSDLGLVNPITVNSGTVTMFLALLSHNIGEGDEVIIPAQTFVATGLVVKQVGANVVFADINPNTGNIDVRSIKEKITNKTKAIIPVHWGGYPCDMGEINELAKKHNLIVIEDAAHALGSTYNNKPIGSISDFTSFSFQAIKQLTTGDGGALCCLNEEKYNHIKNLRWFGIDRENSTPTMLGEREYDLSSVGYKAHMNDISATIGIGNLFDFKKNLNKNRYIAKRYNEELYDVKGIKILDYKKDRESSYWLYPLIVDDRKSFINKLINKNIPTSVVHLGIDKNTIFGGRDMSLKNQRYFDNHQIHLPINPSMTEDQINYIIKTIKE
jgi:perosamine synthetase